MSSSSGLYAAYGSNMDPEQMLERCPHSPAAGTGWLEGWRLTFGGEELGWDGALATLVEDPTDQVYVAVYDLTAEDERSLDQWESIDLGHFHKVKLRVHLLEGDVLAWVYLLDAYEGGLPSAGYLADVAQSAERAGAPDDYVASLRARPHG
jgi:gamma-glutamylcyclotransferase (GGCT)/AIG2-like uncharacterized protein YtfP